MKRASMRVLLGTLALAGLAGCGGGDSGSAAGTSTATGTAAVGAAINGASVELRDARGGLVRAQSDAKGVFNLDGLADGALMVRCTGGTTGGGANALRLHGLALEGRTVNCTPLTELALWKLLGRAPASVFDGFGAASLKGLDAGAVAAAETAVLDALAGGAGIDIDPAAIPVRWNSTRLVAGDAQDAHDRALDAMREVLGTQAPLDLMGEMALRGLCAADGTCS